MTLRNMIDNGINIQGLIKIQSWGDKDYPEVYYEGNIEIDGMEAIEKYLDRDIQYIFPYVVKIGIVSVGAICIEIAEE